MSTTIPRLDLTPVDPYLSADVEAFVAIQFDASIHEQPYATPFRAGELEPLLRDQDSGERWTGWLGRIPGGDPVVAGLVTEALTDNLDKAWIGTWVAPEHRRCGFGSAMMTHLLEVCRRAGRPTVLSSMDFPDIEPGPARAFFEGLGFSSANIDVHRVLDLPVAEQTLDDLIAQAEPHHAGYTFSDSVNDDLPEDLLPTYLELVNALLVDAPTGEVDFEPGGIDVSTWRAGQRTLAAMGRTMYRTLAMAPDGTAAAHTILVVPDHDPGKVFQWATLVSHQHRGRRLGIAVKSRNLRAVQRLHPDRTVVHTWNAEINTWMIAVNELLGFRAVGCGEEFVRNLDD